MYSRSQIESFGPRHKEHNLIIQEHSTPFGFFALAAMQHKVEAVPPGTW